MRTAFIEELSRQARHDPRVFLVVGDLGFSVVESFAAEFPDRFINAGVAEQNMTAVAAGLASEGYHVFTYSIGNFPTLRCLEQIRNDIAYHKLPVTVVSVGGGVAYGNMGYSHHAVQDISALRCLPNMTVLSPADPRETIRCVQFALTRSAPSYLRLGKAGEPELHPDMDIRTGPLEIRSGNAPLAVVATGSVLQSAMAAAEALAQRGISLTVYSCPVIAPDFESKYSPLWRHSRLVTMEEHGLAGGFGSYLKEIAPPGVEICIRGIPLSNADLVGNQKLHWKHAGLDTESTIALVLKILSEQD
jgi:transketolase